MSGNSFSDVRFELRPPPSVLRAYESGRGSGVACWDKYTCTAVRHHRKMLAHEAAILESSFVMHMGGRCPAQSRGGIAARSQGDGQ